MPKITPTIVCLKTKKGLYLKNNFVRRDNNLYYAIMKFWCTIIFIFVVALFAEEREWLSDALLGEPFTVRSLDAGVAPRYHATLVHYPFVSVNQAASAAGSDSVSAGESRVSKASILYIHGFNDYFFQRELAQKMDSAGYSFYAIDLHKYGRSRREGETLGELRDISEYYPELDSAVAVIHRIEGESAPLVVMGHSTGGLIACLYAADRRNGAGIAAIVLNSPFFEMNYIWPVRRLAVPLLSAIGSRFPNVGIPRGKNINYDRSLLRNYDGEWMYDTLLKVPGSLPVDLGWIRAIHQGHERIQQGLHLVSPVLVMHSGCSFQDDDWSEEYTRCDAVLDVDHIREYGAHLGENVRLERIEGGLHDLVLSHEPARDNVYKTMFDFLDDSLTTHH